MTDDICTCGICELDTCDICDGPVLFVDDEGEAWCVDCWERLCATVPEDDDDDVRYAPRRRLTRAERLQGLADRGIDTWDEYEGRA